MAHDLAEVDDFTFPITVPDGTDSRSDAAEVIELIAQGLANRTFNLISHGAFHDSPNTFTGGTNTFADAVLGHKGFTTDDASATEAALTLFTGPDSDPAPGNRWKKVIQALLGGGAADAMMWSGLPAGTAQLLFTINARWDTSAQQWVQQTNTMHSFGMLLAHNGDVTFSRVNSGSGPWSVWPTTGATNIRAQSAAFNGSATVGVDLGVTNDVNVGNDVNVTAQVTATGLVTGGGILSTQNIVLPAGKRVLYSPTAPTFVRVRLCGGVSDAHATAVYFDGSKWTTTTTGYVITIPLPSLPGGTEIDQIWLRYTAAGANGTVELVRNEINDWLVSPSGATPTETVLASGTLTTSGAGVKTVLTTLGTPEVVSNTAYDYSLRITGLAASSHELLGAALTVKLSSPGID